jgi:hypothetical protein
MATLPSPSHLVSEPSLKVHQSSDFSQSSVDYLQVLPQTTPKHNFVSLDDLQQKLKAYSTEQQSKNDGQFLVFLHVPEEEIWRIADDSFPRRVRISYERTTETLIVKMPDAAHEVAIEEIRFLLNTKFAQMNVLDALRKTGSATKFIANWIKEPDAS